MKLYMNPASATSRPVSHFAAEEGIELEEIVIDLMIGEHRQPAYLALNPNDPLGARLCLEMLEAAPVLHNNPHAQPGVTEKACLRPRRLQLAQHQPAWQ